MMKVASFYLYYIRRKKNVRPLPHTKVDVMCVSPLVGISSFLQSSD